MVMNGELGWIEIYKDWQYMRSVYEQEQQALDEKMQQFLEAKGPAPNRQSLDKLRDLGQQLEAKRIAVTISSRHMRLRNRLERHPCRRPMRVWIIADRPAEAIGESAASLSPGIFLPSVG
jgi:hypothetical protein